MMSDYKAISKNGVTQMRDKENNGSIIELINVKKSYRRGNMEIPILHDINLTVME